MNKVKLLMFILFVVALTEIVAEYFRLMPLIYVFKPSISIILMLLYWFSSEKKDALFFLTIGTSLLTNVLFIPNDLYYIFIGLVVFIVLLAGAVVAVPFLFKDKINANEAYYHMFQHGL